MQEGLCVAVVGAGAVGVEMIRVLRQRRFPVADLRVLARSDRELTIDGHIYAVRTAARDAFDGCDIALFAGTEGEKGAAVTLGPEAVRRGALVIDNGSDFRMHPDVPLVVPEVNAEDLDRHRGIIANPNCSTIQLVHALKPIHDLAGVRRVIVSSYQAVSGAGAAAVRELEAQTRAVVGGDPMPPFENIPGQLAQNVLAGCFRFAEDGGQDEEWKLVRESQKILHAPGLQVSATTVRVPVMVGHSESVYLETETPVPLDRVRAALAAFPGIRLVDDPAPTDRDPYARTCPTPLMAAGGDETLVGRLRRDPHVPNGILMWVVADNLRKGAALNAIQIAEEVLRRSAMPRRALAAA